MHIRIYTNILLPFNSLTFFSFSARSEACLPVGREDPEHPGSR